MKRIVKCLVIAGGFSSPAWAQTYNGDTLALQSSGAAAGNGWTLSSDGYVGTYINLSTAAPVTFTLNASGVSSNGLNPDMTLSIADSNDSFNVSSGTLTNYTYTTPTLAPGTYFVRTQLDNQTATQTPTLTIGSLTVAGTGVTVDNSNTSTLALAAATTYATNYRQGPATITLTNSNGVHLGAGTCRSGQAHQQRLQFRRRGLRTKPLLFSFRLAQLEHNNRREFSASNLRADQLPKRHPDEFQHDRSFKCGQMGQQ